MRTGWSSHLHPKITILPSPLEPLESHTLGANLFDPICTLDLLGKDDGN